MRPQHQSLAEFLRHPGTDQPGLTAFYLDTIGLSMLRPYEQIQMLYAGEDLSFELKCDTDPTDTDESDPATAQLIPIIRTHDLAATRERLTAAGHPPIFEESDRLSDTLYVVGPDRLVTAFQHRSPESLLAEDREALRRWHAGPRLLPDVEALAPELHYLSRVKLRVSDVAASSTFLTEVFGFDQVVEEGSSRVHSVGDTVVLEVAPGGASRPLPGDRNEVKAALIFRIHDLSDFDAHARAAGAKMVGEPVRYGKSLAIHYYAGPDNAVIGFMERGGEFDGIEDLEANRRWETLRVERERIAPRR